MVMPSKSKKQQDFMAAVANNPKFAKKAGVPQSVGKDYEKADKMKGMKKYQSKVALCPLGMKKQWLTPKLTVCDESMGERNRLGCNARYAKPVVMKRRYAENELRRARRVGG
jgi:hypothetical protein